MENSLCLQGRDEVPHGSSEERGAIALFRKDPPAGREGWSPGSLKEKSASAFFRKEWVATSLPYKKKGWLPFFVERGLSLEEG